MQVRRYCSTCQAEFLLDEVFANRALRCPFCSASVSPHDQPPSRASRSPEGAAVPFSATQSAPDWVAYGTATSTEMVRRATASTFLSRLPRILRLHIVTVEAWRRLVVEAKQSLLRTLVAAGSVAVAFLGMLLLLFYLIR